MLNHKTFKRTWKRFVTGGHPLGHSLSLKGYARWLQDGNFKYRRGDAARWLERKRRT